MATVQGISTPVSKTILGASLYIVTNQISYTINHNYGFRPRVEIIMDPYFELVEADVFYPTMNSINIVFGSPFTGRIIIG